MRLAQIDRTLSGRPQGRAPAETPGDAAAGRHGRSRPAARQRLRRRRVRLGHNLLIYLALGAFFLFLLGPIVWLFLSSLQKPVDNRAIPPIWLFTPQLDQYANLFWRRPIWDRFLSSLVASVGSVGISVLAGAMAAYAIAGMGRRAQSITSFLFLLYRMVPLAVIVLPLYMLFQTTGLYDTQPGLILAYINISLPVVVWLMIGFFAAVPVELEDAATLDGCSALQYFFRIALPLAAPGLASVAILCLTLAWSDFILAVALTGPHTKTIAVEVRGGGSAAISVMAVLPLFAFALLLQRRLVQGLTVGAVKQ